MPHLLISLVLSQPFFTRCTLRDHHDVSSQLATSLTVYYHFASALQASIVMYVLQVCVFIPIARLETLQSQTTFVNFC